MQCRVLRALSGVCQLLFLLDVCHACMLSRVMVHLISCSCFLLLLLSLAACSLAQRMLRMLSLAGCLQSEGVIEDNMGARRLLADT